MVCTIYNSTKAKRDSHGVWWCAQRTTIEVSMKRVFGVTVNGLGFGIFGAKKKKRFDHTGG